jgi:hypothetical protein
VNWGRRAREGVALPDSPSPNRRAGAAASGRPPMPPARSPRRPAWRAVADQLDAGRPAAGRVDDDPVDQRGAARFEGVEPGLQPRSAPRRTRRTPSGTGPALRPTCSARAGGIGGVLRRGRDPACSRMPPPREVSEEEQAERGQEAEALAPKHRTEMLEPREPVRLQVRLEGPVADTPAGRGGERAGGQATARRRPECRRQPPASLLRRPFERCAAVPSGDTDGAGAAPAVA